MNWIECLFQFVVHITKNILKNGMLFHSVFFKRTPLKTHMFRRHLQHDSIKHPSYLYFGLKFVNIIHTKLRHNCILEFNLYRCNTMLHTGNTTSHTVFICHGYLDYTHHLFLCVRNHWHVARQVLISYLLSLTYLIYVITSECAHVNLVRGYESLSVENKSFKAVQTFIYMSVEDSINCNINLSNIVKL